MEKLRNFVSVNFNIWSTLFWFHQRRQLKQFREFFDTIESNPLTELQRRAIILNERRNLVVAGAGTGKTSVIVAKAGYLVRSGFCKPEELLLLAFNRSAADELTKRCRERLGFAVAADTFHGLGNKIIAAAETRAPGLSVLATDSLKLSVFIRSLIDDLRKSEDKRKRLLDFFIELLKSYKPESNFKSITEYCSYVRSAQLRALSGDYVKSFAEFDIANFLYRSGVTFEYEPKYPHTTYRYQPDFYLPEYRLYIEHFGVDKFGQTAPYIDGEAYRQGMVKKRASHAEYGTKLLETFSWQRSEGTLISTLDKQLTREGVKYSPINDDRLFDRLNAMGYVSQFEKLISTFLTHCKSNGTGVEKLRTIAAGSGQGRRAREFVELFSWFYERYEGHLADRQEIDFNDMIGLARARVEAGQFSVPWKYIIVDEFQDISVGRYRLLEAMLKSNDELHFFAVGDDWQSINRFAGSDISIMADFRDHFGRATIVKLDRTFRFNDSIAKVSGRFIQKNPRQIQKSLTTNSHSSRPQVKLHWSTEESQVALLKAIKRVMESEDVQEASLLVVGRYNHSLPTTDDRRQIERLWPGSVMVPKTIHRAKGLEADFVFVTDLKSGSYAFPSEIEDDPLINLVLAVKDPFKHAEERRLFYVAVTRARRQTHLLVNTAEPSSFAMELTEDGYDVEHVGRDPGLKDRCPECGGGVVREKRDGFFVCSNFPYCEYVAPLCNVCRKGFMHRKEGAGFRCSDPLCAGRLPICPACGKGALISKEGKYGTYVKCHTWPKCNFTPSKRVGLKRDSP